MNKKYIYIMLATILVFCMAGAGTMAWFTSSDSSTGNVFDVGNLEIEQIASTPMPLFGTDNEYTSFPEAIKQIYAVNNWYPGLVVGDRDLNNPFGTERSLTIKNTGDIVANVCGITATITEFYLPNDSTNYADVANISGYPKAKAAYDEFVSKLKITVKSLNQTVYPVGTFTGTLQELVSGTIQPLNAGILNANSPQTIDLNFIGEMDTSAGNEIQGVTAKVNINVYATQNIQGAVDNLLGVTDPINRIIVVP